MEKMVLEYDTCCVKGDFLWVSAMKFNGLFKIDLRTKEINFVGCFPYEKLYGRLHLDRIIEHNNKLYFVPFESNYIHIYDIEKNTFEGIKIERKAGRYHGGIKYGDKIFFISPQTSIILELDTQSNAIKYIHIDEVEGFIWYPHIYKNKMYLSDINETVLMKIDLTTYEKSIIKNNAKIRLIGHKGQYIYLQDKIEGEIEVYDLELEQSVLKKNVFFDYELIPWQTQNYIINTNTCCDNIVLLNMDNCEVTRRQKKIVDKVLYLNIGLIPFAYKGVSYFVFGDDFSAVNIETGEVGYRFIMNEELLGEIKKKHMEVLEMKGIQNKLIKENHILGLSHWLKFI